MDRKPQADPEIQRLIQLSAVARTSLKSEVCALRQRLDVPARIRGSLKDHPAAWMLGSLASGLAASLVLRRSRPAAPKTRRLPAKMLGIAWSATRPLVKVWLGGQVKNWLAGQTGQAVAGRILSRFSANSKYL